LPLTSWSANYVRSVLSLLFPKEYHQALNVLPLNQFLGIELTIIRVRSGVILQVCNHIVAFPIH
jgi:hypothetical protein